MGVIYRTKGDDVIYRVLLSKTEQHVYYYIDDDADEVVVVTPSLDRKRRIESYRQIANAWPAG